MTLNNFEMKTTILLLFAFANGLLNAQIFKIVNGAEYDCPKINRFTDPINGYGDAFYFVKNATAYFANKDVLHKLDINNANTVYYKEFGYDIDGLKWNISSLGHFNNDSGKIWMFLRCINDAQTKIKIFVREFSSITGEETAKPKIIDELEMKDNGGLISRLIAYQVTASEDGSKILLVSEYKQDEKEQEVKLRILDGKNLEGISLKYASTIYQNSTIFSENYLIDNLGNIAYTFSYLYNYKDGWRKTAYGIGIIPATDKDNFLYCSFGKDKYRTGRFRPILKNCNGKVICTGQIIDHTTKPEKLGFYFCKLDMINAKILSESIELLDEKVVNNLSYKENKVSGVLEKELYFYQAINANNGFYVIRYHYYFAPWGGEERKKEIIIHRYSIDGKQEWVKLIPHFGVGSFGNFGIISGKKTYLFYYDNPINLAEYPEITSYNPKKYKKAKSFYNAKLVCLSFDETGKFKRELVNTDVQQIALLYNYPDITSTNNKKCLITETQISKTRARYNLLKLVE